MNLFNAYDFVFSVRPGWSNESKSIKQTRINSQHVRDVLGDISVSEIEPIHYIRIQQELKTKGLTNGTINRVTSTLSVVIGEMVKHKVLTSRVEFSQLPESRGRIVYYTEEEISDMLAASRLLQRDADVTYDILFVASRTGARKGELVALQWEDIDWNENSLTFYDTKNGEDRVLPLTDSLRSHLQTMEAQRIDNRVFPIPEHRILSNLRKVQEMCAIKQEKNFHTFRHSVATHLFAKGASLPVVKEVMGHKNSAVTMRYAHATNAGKLEAMSLL